MELFEGARGRARELGCQLEEFALGEVTPARMRTVLLARGIRAVLAAPLPGDHREFPLDISDFVVVGLGMSVIEPSIMRVASDLYQLGRVAAHRCADLGYRRLGFAVSAEMSARLEHRLLAGFRQGLGDAGLPDDVPPMMPPQTAGFSTLVGSWCRREKPDVVIFGTFDRACLQATPREIGCADLCVLGGDSELSGMQQSLDRIGAIAIEQLLTRLHHNATGPIEEPQAYLLHGTWVDGKTTPGPGRRLRWPCADGAGRTWSRSRPTSRSRPIRSCGNCFRSRDGCWR